MNNAQRAQTNAILLLALMQIKTHVFLAIDKAVQKWSETGDSIYIVVNGKDRLPDLKTFLTNLNLPGITVTDAPVTEPRKGAVSLTGDVGSEAVADALLLYLHKAARAEVGSPPQPEERIANFCPGAHKKRLPRAVI